MKVKPIVLIHKDLLIFSNNKTDQGFVNTISEKLNAEKFQVISVYKSDKGYVVTDGNHRAKAAIQAGINYIPAVVLTKKEYDFVKFSDRSFPVKAFMPENPRMINSL